MGTLNTKFYLIAMFTWLCWLIPAQANDATKILATGTTAGPDRQEDPHYPREAFRLFYGGWTLVTYDIDKYGKTSNVEVVSTSREDLFENSAETAVRNWTFDPATDNGAPVTQNHNQHLAVHQRSRGVSNKVDAPDYIAGGVTRDFKWRQAKAIKALEARDFEKAKYFIRRLELRPQILLSEIAHLEILKGQLRQAEGKDAVALEHYEFALKLADKTMKEELRISTLSNAFTLSVKQKKLVKALSHFQTLSTLREDLPPDNPIQEQAGIIQTLLDSDTQLAIEGHVEDECRTCSERGFFWEHSLYRSEFSVHSIEGRLKRLKLLCGSNYVIIAFEQDMVWNADDERGQCDIHVYGDVGSTFTLVEH